MKNRHAPRMPLAPLKDRIYEADPVPNSVSSDADHSLSEVIEGNSTIATHREVTELNAKVTASFEIPLKLIDRSPWQPRIRFDPTELDMLASSVAEGLVSPISVRALSNGRYELVGGERRVRAYQALGKESIQAHIINDMSPMAAALAALSDNEAKESLTDYERGVALRRILDMAAGSGSPMSQASLAKSVGVSTATISRCLTFFELPNEVTSLLQERPELVGGKNAPKLAQYCRAGHTELVLRALRRRIEEDLSEHAALNFIALEVNKKINAPKKLTSLRLHGMSVGNIKTEGQKIIITCKSGFNPSDLISRLSTLDGAELTDPE